jgi:hypothetical protein
MSLLGPAAIRAHPRDHSHRPQKSPSPLVSKQAKPFILISGGPAVCGRFRGSRRETLEGRGQVSSHSDFEVKLLAGAVTPRRAVMRHSYWCGTFLASLVQSSYPAFVPYPALHGFCASPHFSPPVKACQPWNNSMIENRGKGVTLSEKQLSNPHYPKAPFEFSVKACQPQND